MIQLWRGRWSEMSRVTRGGFWLTVVAATVGLSASVVRLASDHTVPWDGLSDPAMFLMFIGMGVQSGGHARDRRDRARAHI